MDLDQIMNLRKQIADLDAQLMEQLDSASQDEAANALLMLNLAKRDLSYVYDTVSARIATMLKEDIIELDSGAVIERKIASNRTGWRHRDLGRDVADRIVQSSIDPDTGEIVVSPSQMIEKMLDYVQPSYWRTGALNGIGINADNYCETSEPKTSIIVRKGDAK